MQRWAVWYPKALATGMLFGRGLMDSCDRLLLHAAPEVITVEVCDEDGSETATGEELKRTQESPMCLLRLDGSNVTREDIWPGQNELKLPVMLPGGEVGKLMSWWHAEDKKEWRWTVEFYNSARDEQSDSWAR